MPGDLSGSAVPVYIPLITDIANIQSGLRNFYYGTASAVSNENDIEANSIAGRIIALRDGKLDKSGGTAITSLTIDSTTASSPTLSLKTTGGQVNITVPTLSGTTSLVFPTSGTVITDSVATLSSLSSIGSNASTITIGGTTATTYSIGTSAKSSGTKTINLGAANDTVTKTLNLGTGSTSSTTTVNIGTNSGGTSAINTYGTLTHTGAATISSTLGVTGTTTLGALSVGAVTGSSTIQGTSFIIGASGPTITAGTGVPASSPPNGSLYVRTDGANTTALYARSSSTWNAVRGNMWFSGTGAPGTLTGQQIGDFYVDRLNGKVYQLA